MEADKAGPNLMRLDAILESESNLAINTQQIMDKLKGKQGFGYIEMDEEKGMCKIVWTNKIIKQWVEIAFPTVAHTLEHDLKQC